MSRLPKSSHDAVSDTISKNIAELEIEYGLKIADKLSNITFAESHSLHAQLASAIEAKHSSKTPEHIEAIKRRAADNLNFGCELGRRHLIISESH